MRFFVIPPKVEVLVTVELSGPIVDLIRLLVTKDDDRRAMGEAAADLGKSTKDLEAGVAAGQPNGNK